MLAEQLLSELDAVAGLGPIEVRSSTDEASDLLDVVHDSRQVKPGDVFCAVPGLRVDGHDFVGHAAAAGAVALIVHRWVDAAITQIKVSDVRRVMPHVAAAVHGHPSGDISIFGITGTNGKTTTAQLLSGILTAGGRSCAVIGTLGGVHTTPESTDLQRRLRSHVDAGIEVVALEVSSHALAQFRVDATRFAVAAFSNLTPDHLDYHVDMQQYFASKKRLFDGRADQEIISIDDPWGTQLADERRNAMTVSVHDVEIVRETIAGTDFVWRGLDAHVPLPGLMNVANALMAAEAALLLGLEPQAIVDGLAAAQPVPGRMQRVEVGRDSAPVVVVDYSHTPDSIERALETMRKLAGSGNVSIVFGCGGDRDRLKRPLMGEAAEAGADRVYLTSDNPRSEDPLLIIADALAGMREPGDVVVEPDRRSAIRRAIITSGPNDVVLIAGKGHEKTQTIGPDVLPFDDVSVARDLLEEHGS